MMTPAVIVVSGRTEIDIVPDPRARTRRAGAFGFQRQTQPYCCTKSRWPVDFAENVLG
jgi:hypothetical protein